MSYQLLHTVSFIFFLLFIVFLFISIILFWKWSIIQVWQELTGRLAQKSIVNLYQSTLQKEHKSFYRTNTLNLQSVRYEKDETEKIDVSQFQESYGTDELHRTVILSNNIQNKSVENSTDGSSQRLDGEGTTILKINEDNETTLLQRDVDIKERIIFEEIVHIVVTDTKEFL